MSLQAKLIALLVLALAGVGACLGCYWWGHSAGDKAGADRIQGQWDAAKKKADEDTARIRGEGFALAAQYEGQLQVLEKRYASTSSKLRAAQRLPVTCPASGEIGDVVVPAAFVRSMFNRDDPGRPAAPGPAASEPAH